MKKISEVLVSLFFKKGQIKTVFFDSVFIVFSFTLDFMLFHYSSVSGIKILIIELFMIIVIDAYNLLHTIPPYKRVITESEKARFVALIGTYGRIRGNKMVIVFDGGPYELPHKDRMHGVTVVHSGVHSNADEYIKGYLNTLQAQDIILVSSDNELIAHAAALKIPSIGSFSFYELIKKALQAGGERELKKGGGDIVKMQQEPSEIDELMREGSKMVPTKSEDIAQGGEVGLQKKAKLGKHERKLLEKLKKL